jgi:hypothetical protein
MLNAKYIVGNHSKIIFILQKSITQLQGSKTQSKGKRMNVERRKQADAKVRLSKVLAKTDVARPKWL